MATSEQLRYNINQHKPKNIRSKKDDKEILKAQGMTVDYLRKRFSEQMGDYYIDYSRSISFSQMQKVIKDKRIRTEFETMHNHRTIAPDGGILLLRKYNSEEYLKILLIAEVKRQGTNKDRVQEGKIKQSIGNAIERLGKNVIGIRAMLNHENITPFVCFCWGCDFTEEYTQSKICMMNEFYPLNHMYVHKRDGNSDYNRYSPVSIYYQEEQWTAQNMYNIMKEIAETALRYYIF